MSPYRGSVPFTDRWEHFDLDITRGVATVIFDRPDRLNALTFDVCAELRDLLVELPHREEVSALIITEDSARVGTSTRSSGGCWRWTPARFSISPA